MLNTYGAVFKYEDNIMKIYEKGSFEIIEFQDDDIIITSPGGIEFGKDDDGNNLGWD